MIKKVYLHATKHPCTENAMNLNLLRRWYSANDWEVTKEPSEADIIVVSTCGFSSEQEDYEIATIKKLGEIKKAGCELIVAGCLPQINKDRLKSVFEGRTVPTSNIEKFDEIMNFPKKMNEFENHFVSQEDYDTDPRIRMFFRARKLFERFEFLPFVKVPRILYTVPSEKWYCVRGAMGCTGNCSYCGIKNAHGPLKSEPISSIVSQVKKGLEMGYREIALTGEDMGGYGVDIKSSLADLLNELVCLPGKFRINLRFIDPFWLFRLKQRLIPAFKTGKIKSFCAPAQSGSDGILKAMNRRYTFEQIKETVNYVMEKTKVSMISTNIIVGFPGETEDDLIKTMRLIDEVAFGMYMVFKYEERPNTKAALLPGKISPAEIDRRYKIVHDAVIKKHLKNIILG